MITETDSIIALLEYNDGKPSTLKYTEVNKNKALKLQNKYRKEVRDWIASTTKKTVKPLKLDYSLSKDSSTYSRVCPNGVFCTLSEDINKILVEGKNPFESWPNNGELNLEYITKVETLRDLIPINQSVTLFGVDDRPPSTFEQKKWLRYAEVFMNPHTVIEKLEAGTLSSLEVEALELFFPSILSHIQESLVEGVSELKGKDIDTRVLGHEKLKLAYKVLQIPRLSPEALKQLQGKFTSPEEGMKDVDVPENTQTDATRISFK